jgi:cytohesin
LTESQEPSFSLQEAAAIGDVNMVSSLLKKGVGVDSWEGTLKKTALQRAAMSGHKEVVTLLLAKGARIDAQEDFPGGTALDYAAEKSHKEIAELLIAHGANVNAARRRYPAGDTPLHSAVRAGHKDIIELLIDKGADVNAKNNEGQTPIDTAMDQNHKDIVELFLEKGAKLSLHVAVYLGDIDKVKSFIETGVSVNVESGPRKRTPLYWAVKNKHKDVAKLLIDKGADVSSIHLLYYASWYGYRDFVELFIQKGADANSKNWGESPSHYAVWGGHADILELLLVKGADANAKDTGGWSLLHYTAGSGSMDMTKILLDKDADVNAKEDKGGQTPLHRAAEKGHITVAELLIANGADVNAKENEGKTALSVAKDKGHTEIVELLRKHGAKEDKAEVTQDTWLPILDVERKRNGTYLTIRSESIPGLLLDVWCYEDKLGDATRYEKQGGAVVLIHKLEEATVTTRFEPSQTGVDIEVHVTGPTAEVVRKVQRLNPCCQFARSAAFRSEGNYVDDFVARCFVFLDAGMTLLKDTKRIPGTRPRTDDKANYPKPWIQEYFPAWRKHPGQIKGQRGYSPDRPVYPIIGAVSRDGKYLAAIAWPETASLGQVWHHCIHPRPLIAESFDSKTGEIRSCGKIYLMENDEEKLLARFKEDFPHWRSPPDVR